MPLCDRYIHALFEGSMDAMVIANDDGHFVEVNQAACDLFGLERDEFANHNLGTFIQAGLDRELAWFGQRVQTQTQGNFLLNRVRECPRDITFTVTPSILPQRHLVVLRDVTEQRQLERQVQHLRQALNHQEATQIRPLKRLLDHLPVCVAYVDGDRRYRYVNQTYQTWFQIPAEAILGNPVEQVLGASVYPLIRPHLDRALAGDYVTFELTAPFQYGGTRHVQASLVPNHDEQGVVQGVYVLVLDLSDRHQLELALQTSQQKYQTLFEILPLGVSITDAEGNLVEANPASEEILGISTEDHTQRRYDAPTWQILYVDGTPMPSEDYASVRALRENRAIAGQEQGIVRPDGTVQWISVSAAPLPLENHGVAITYVDITDLKAAEIALRESNAYYQSLADALPLCLYRKDREGRCTFANRALLAMTGQTLESLVGKTVHELYPPDLAGKYAADDAWVIETGNILDTVETHQSPATGETFYVQVVKAPVWNEQGELIGTQGIFWDVSDRKAAEVLLQQREQEFRTLVENAPDKILRFDRQLRFLYVNPTVQRLTGIPAQTFLGKHMGEVGFPAPLIHTWQAALHRAFNTGHEQTLETQEILPSGHETFFSRIVPEGTMDGTIPSVLVVSRNISNLKKAQDALMQLAEQESTLRLITQHIRETLDLDAILRTTVMEVQRILHADRTLIFRLNSDRVGMVTQEVVRPEYPIMLHMCWADECFPSDCYAFYCQGHTRIVPNISVDTWGECLAEFMQRMGVKSKMVAPIPQTREDGSTQIWGLLVTHACEEQRNWHLEEADLLQQVANQLAIAIHQSELYEKVQVLNTNLERQVQERTAQLQRSFEFEAILNRITERLRDSLDEQRILDAMITELAQHLDILFGNIALYDPLKPLLLQNESISIVSEYNPNFPALNNLILPADHFPEIEYQLNNKVQFQCCVRLVRLDRWVSVLLNPVVDENEVALGDILLLREADQHFDTAEQKLVQQVANQCAIALRQSRLYQSAQAQVTELERLNNLKDDFLSTVSHELRSPMANIKVATELLEVQLVQLGVLSGNLSETPSPTPLDRYFQILKDESHREMTLINDLLDLARLDAQTEPLLPAAIDLQRWLPHLLEPFETYIHKSQQHLALWVSPDIPPLTSDPASLQRVLMELLTNACKYTPPGDRIEVAAQVQGEWIEIRVSNSGVTIPPVECDRIFDRFYRIPNTDPWKHGGTGLGLALAKKLVEFLQGHIRAECEGGYVHVIVQLPLHLNVPS